MDDAGVVGGRQCAGDSGGDVDHFANVEPARGHPLAQRFAFDVLGGDVMRAAVLADLINRDDVRMIERRGRARLALKAAYALLVPRESHRQQLERDLAIERLILGKIALAHPAGADEPPYEITRNPLRLHGLVRSITESRQAEPRKMLAL